ENGTGKSSICNILKNLSNNLDFEKYPKKVEIKTDGDTFKYNSYTWAPNKLQKDSILFFDKDFIAKYIHLNAERKGDANGHEQKSGQLIIEFDKKAISLNRERKKARDLKDDLKNSKNSFYNDNLKILNFKLFESEKEFLEKYKNKNEEEIKNDIEKLEYSKNNLAQELKLEKENLTKITAIQNIPEDVFNEYKYILNLSSFRTYYELFWFSLKENAKADAEKTLIQKIKTEKKFFESGFEVYEKFPNKCPFCQSETEKESIQKVINTYQQIFDDSYEKQKSVFESQKKELSLELQNIESELNEIDLNIIFRGLNEIKEKFRLTEIYSIENENNFKKSKIENLENFYKKIENLEKPNKEDIAKIYQEVFMEVKKIKEFVEELNKFLKSKKEILYNFKQKNTSENLQKSISDKEQKIEKIKNEADFLKEKEIEKYKQKEICIKKLQEKTTLFEQAEKSFEIKKLEYDKYCESEIFQKFIENIQKYLGQFDLNFVLEPEDRNRVTNEKQFSFVVFDKEKNKRSFRDGLSEGELQILSFCFFFAFLDSYPEQKNKILVFDDPVTSLDDGNLSKIVDIIFEKQKNFSQTFIFTHHKTFFRFLCKGKDKPKEGVFNILKNKKSLGGSFICKNKSIKIIEKLKNIESIIKEKAINGIEQEMFTIKYGQYLRFEVENFIKNKLLYWNEYKFSNIINGIKSNQEICKDDFDTIKTIYDFCNWSNTNHIGKEPTISLEQLKVKVNEFVVIYEKYAK
ncbi:AAA family ATPase, partial [Candidatus Parcubacteria bacterium]|nr:AAA family ATPase [Candidatus Parcubacteria bacterium]